MLKDVNNNVIAVCRFESYLAKFFVENFDYFESLYTKIFNAIDAMVLENKANSTFDVNRMLFSCVSGTSKDFASSGEYVDIKTSSSLLMKECFIKRVCEMILKSTDVLCSREETTDAKVIDSLQYLATLSLFKNPHKGGEKAEKKIRKSILFAEKERGATAVYDEFDGTKKLGILRQKDTPEELQAYFNFTHYPAQYDYKPREESYVAKWLRARNLPVISGTSGTTEVAFSQLNKIMSFTQDELKRLFLAQACATIALGHHSFFEVMLVKTTLGFKLDDSKIMADFYKQCIPSTIFASKSFQAFWLSDNGVKLLENVPYNPTPMIPQDATFRRGKLG